MCKRMNLNAATEQGLCPWPVGQKKFIAVAPLLNKSLSQTVKMSRNNRISRSNLWSTSRQNARVFNWCEELENWSENLTMNPYVQTVVDNLHAAVDPDGPDVPLSHFRTYLNDEPEALKWFLYECVAMRWMWGNVRLDFVRDLMHLIDLDSQFPSFVGSPQGQTIRQFLEQHLTSEEKDAVDLMPPLVRATNIHVTYTPARQRLVELLMEESEDSESEDSDSDSDDSDYEEAVGPLLDAPAFLIRFLRKANPKRASTDDVVVIRPSTDDTLYHISFKDLDSKLAREVFLPLQGVRRYISAVLRSVNRDDDPFLCVQLEPPAAPSVLFNTSNLTAEIRDIIYDHLELAFDFWPTAV